MERIYGSYRSLLDGFGLEPLEKDPNPVYGLSDNHALVYLNPGWFAFAKANGGEPAITERFCIGTYLGDAMSGDVRRFYLDAFRDVLLTGKVWHHDYECSTPDVFRMYHQTVYPLREQRGLIVVNSLIEEHPHDAATRIPCPPRQELYVWETGLITQCSNCRRVQCVSQPERWDWVPAWVRQVPANTSHSFCPVCFEYYWRYRGNQVKV